MPLTISSIAADCLAHIRPGKDGIYGEQASYLVNSINTAIEDMRVLCPQEFQKTLALTWTGSRTGTVAVTLASQTVAAGTLTPLPANGCSIRITGDSTWNEMLKTGTLLFPFTGATGSPGATAYGDSVLLDSAVDRVLGCALLHERRPLEVANSRDEWEQFQALYRYGDYGYGITDLPQERQPGIPRAMWLETALIGGTTIEYRARCTPLPTGDFRATLDVATMPDSITVADIAANATSVRPVPGQRVYGILRALALYHWSGAPWFRNDSARQVIATGYASALAQLGGIRPHVAEVVHSCVRY